MYNMTGARFYSLSPTIFKEPHLQDLVLAEMRVHVSGRVGFYPVRVYSVYTIRAVFPIDYISFPFFARSSYFG